MEHGSLQNLIAGSSAVPKVGEGLTVVMWTDRKAGTITRVSPSGKTLQYRLDKAVRVDTRGMCDSQEYRYEPQSDAPEETARLTSKGWRNNKIKIVVGVRDVYHDYSF